MTDYGAMTDDELAEAVARALGWTVHPMMGVRRSQDCAWFKIFVPTKDPRAWAPLLKSLEWPWRWEIEPVGMTGWEARAMNYAEEGDVIVHFGTAHDLGRAVCIAFLKMEESNRG